MINQKVLTYILSTLTVVMFSMPITVNAQIPTMEEVQAMEDHWNLIFRERDQEKRQALIDEHKEMMSSYSSRKSLRTIHQTSSEGMMEHNMDMINTIKLHTDMMRILNMN